MWKRYHSVMLKMLRKLQTFSLFVFFQKCVERWHELPQEIKFPPWRSLL
jgi:hypothetical protein